MNSNKTTKVSTEQEAPPIGNVLLSAALSRPKNCLVKLIYPPNIQGVDWGYATEKWGEGETDFSITYWEEYAEKFTEDEAKEVQLFIEQLAICHKVEIIDL